ncbi:MAG TPA: AAA family ATPase [Solirubrobacteraceae bacterium]|nr:AAA family ATPase [Solirubrobacteraceae bacterium]
MGADTDKGVFVGREAELAVVAEALDGARAGRSQLLVIEGEPGIGKTAFLRRCRDAADGFVVLEASGEESEADLDLGVVRQVLSHAPAAAGAIGAAVGTTSNPFAVGAELLSLLGSLQETGPVLLVVDDAHWIDPASAGALLFACRRLYADHVCALIATRPGGDGRAGGWSRFLQDAERTRRIRLGGLDGHEVGSLAASLLRTPLSRTAAERLRAHTDGHPLYIRALVDELGADALTSEHGPLPAPHSFAATVLSRLATLSPQARDLAAAAAVAGPRCRAELAAAAAGIGDSLQALDELLEAGVLMTVAGRLPTEVRFSHPLTRAAIYDDLSLSRRRTLHLALAELTDGAAALAHRVAASSDADDELAAELMEVGGAEVLEGRLTAGVDHLLLAHRIAASRALGERALLNAVDALGLAGDVPRARELREAVQACADTARRSFTLGCLNASAGRLEESVHQLLAVTRRPDLADDPDLIGTLHSSLAIVCAYAGRGAEAIEWAQRALADKAATATVVVTARQGLALGLAHSGREREAAEALGPVATTQPNPAPFEVELIATRGGIRAQGRDLEGALQDLEAVAGWARAGAAPRSLPNAYASLADVEYWLGRWRTGVAHAELAVSLARDSDQVWELPFAHATAGRFAAGRGDWTAAAEHVDAAAWAAQLAPLPLSVFSARLAAASVASIRGEWETVLDVLESLWAQLPAPVAVALRRRSYELEAEALLRTGALDEAGELLGETGGREGVQRITWWRLVGTLEHASGNARAAREAFAAGRQAAREAPSPLAEGLLELAHGRVLRRSGRRGAAAAALQLARERFDGLGARSFVERCDGELSACGVRISAGGSEDLGLSPREAAVAALVASGKSNREAGAELYLSTKAIEYHLGNIFAKLGIRSRHELASRLAAGDGRAR